MSNRFTSRLSDNDDYKRDELIRKIEHAVEHMTLSELCLTICLLKGILRIEVSQVSPHTPWAKSFWAFSPCLSHMRKFNQ